MTGMEQGLTYIEREIRYMIKDQGGNSSGIHYADRVIEDTCGISGFCTSVVSARKPLSVILKAVKGPRGNILMKFFNVSLHDARVDMALVLSELGKNKGTDKESKEIRDYLEKLYKKSVKRTIKLITGSKGKESYKSLYDSLRSYAKMDDFYDDYDDYDSDNFLDDEEEFIESPNEEKKNSYWNSISLKGNEEILKDISDIEEKLGRHLSDSELDKLLCGEDDNDDDITPLYPNDSEIKNLDNLVELIANKVTEKLENSEKPHKPKMETFDEFKERMEAQLNNSDDTEKEKDEDVEDTEINESDDNPSMMKITPVRTVIKPMLGEPSIEELIRQRNQHQHKEDKKSSNDKSESIESSNGMLPPSPSNMLGGSIIANIHDNISDITNKDAMMDRLFNDDDDDSEEDFTDNNEKNDIIKKETELKVSEINLSNKDSNTAESNDTENHSLLAQDIIRNYEIGIKTDLNQFSARFKNLMHNDGVELVDSMITIHPSDMTDKLLNLKAIFRISGDPDYLDTRPYGLMMKQIAINAAEELEIDENLIDTDYEIVVICGNAKPYNEELAKINTDAKTYSSDTVVNVNGACSALSTYIYKRLNKNVNIRYINNPDKDYITLYFSGKDENLDVEFAKFFGDELVDEDIINSIFKGFDIDNEIKTEIIADNSFDAFTKELETIIKHEINNEVFMEYQDSISEAITQWFDISNVSVKVSSIVNNTITPNGSLIRRIVYTITSPSEISTDMKSYLKNDIKSGSDFKISMSEILKAISSSYDVIPTIQFSVNGDMIKPSEVKRIEVE